MSLLSLTEWARRQGFSRQYAHQLVKAGKIHTLDGKIDETTANSALAAIRALQSSTAVTGDTESQQLSHLLLKTRIKNELSKGELLAIKAKAEQGKMVSLEIVEKLLFAITRTSRDRLLNLADRLGHVLASMNDAAAISQLIAVEIRQALDALAQPDLNQLRSKNRLPTSPNQDEVTDAIDP